MEIIAVDNNWKPEVLNLDITLSNVCNYKCWYCWPGSNSGDQKFPDAGIFKKNILHLVNYYMKHTNKRMFDIHFTGGEPTHWTKLGEVIKFCKENFPCLISMTSNGSKKFSWWEEYASYFDRIHLSCHHQYVKLDEYRDLCDWLYTKNVVVSVSVMMDPYEWDKCIDIVEYLKGSKKRWTIRYVDIVNSDVQYTEDQLKLLSNHRARRVNPFWFFRNNKYYQSKVVVIDKKNKKHKLKDNEILLNRMNNFNGWECSVGVNWIHVSADGKMSCTQNQTLYRETKFYNLYDKDFEKNFKPNILSAICEQKECVCSIETVMPKRKLP